MSDAPAPRHVELHEQPGHLIRRAHQIAIAVFHDTVGREVTPIQYAVLRILQDQPGIDQVTLARQAALDTSTTADIAARLDSKGWIEREVLARGRRSLRLTSRGREMLDTLLPGIESVQQQLLGRLAEPEQAALLRLLRKFVDQGPAAAPD